jgi:ATP-dependent helicase/DNAse subunit B
MPITLITGPANAGKAELVLDGVRRELAHGSEPLLVVPTRADAEHYLRELAGDAVAMGVRVERFAGLLDEVAVRAGVSEPVLGAIARDRLLQALARRASRVGDGSAGEGPAGRGFVRALGELFAELQARRVTPARLSRALERWREADGIGVERPELGGLFAAYRAELRRLRRLDREERSVRALDALRERPSLWGGTPVAFYGFDDLTTLQLDAIETLGAIVDAPVVVSLAYEPGRTAFAGRAATFHALAPLAREHRSLPARAEHYAPPARSALSHLERSLFEPGAARLAHGAAVRLLEGGGERAELELVAREIAALLGEGVAAEEIAVLARPAGAAPELLEEVFAAARIPLALQRRRPFADTATGRALIGLLDCVAPGRPTAEQQTAGARAGGLGDLLAYLRAPGLLEQPALADRLELAARRAGALDSESARSLWEQRHWPLEAIDRLREAQQRGTGALLDRAARECNRLFVAPRRSQAVVLDGEELDEAGAVSVARRAFAELRELARLAPELAPASARELAEVLGSLTVLSGERPAAGAVALLDPLALRARRVRALFVCGLQEGVFPARARPQPLFGEDDRRRLAEVSGLRLGEHEDLLAAERYLLYAALSRPEELLVLSWHGADDDGQPTSRSLFVDDVCDLFDRSLFDDRARRSLGASDAAFADGASSEVASPARATIPPPAGTDQPLRDARLLDDLRARPWSASAIERFIACPVSWFVQRVLRPGELDPDPEPLTRGALAHAALKDVFEGLRRETGSARLTAARLGLARELLASALDENERARPLSVAPERRGAARRRLDADLDRFLQRASETVSELEPVELELGFGFGEDDDRGEASELAPFEVGDGVRMRGRIDRVDVGPNGEAIVFDYKGKDPPAAARWISDGKLQVALYMLAVEELLSLRAVGGFYQPLTGAELRPRGVLDGDSGVELDCVVTDVRDHDELRELLAQARASALEATERAGSGGLHAQPQTCAFRGGCMYPTICRSER